MNQAEHVAAVQPPGANSRTWPLGGHAHQGRRQHPHLSPEAQTLVACRRCKDKGSLKVWRVRVIPPRTWTPRWGIQRERVEQHEPGWNLAVIECLDAQACIARVEEQDRRVREQRERRRPPLPHAGAPKGHCKWCGEEIRFDESVKGWKRCRQRSYHRGDRMELGEENCLLHAMTWLDPKRATQYLLDRQDGKCVECGEVLATPRPYPEHWGRSEFGLERFWSMGARTASGGRLQVDIDHEVPVWKGGTNVLENLRAICNDPCHKAKTRREAAERAALRKAAAGAGVTAGEQPQLALDSLE